MAEVCRRLQVSAQTYQRWRSQFKAMRPEDVVRAATSRHVGYEVERVILA